MLYPGEWLTSSASVLLAVCPLPQPSDMNCESTFPRAPCQHRTVKCIGRFSSHRLILASAYLDPPYHFGWSQWHCSMLFPWVSRKNSLLYSKAVPSPWLSTSLQNTETEKESNGILTSSRSWLNDLALPKRSSYQNEWLNIPKCH